MKKLSALVDAIKAALKHCSERVKASARGRSVCANPGVAYAPVRCREHTVVRRRKIR
jgi:hypothetical protein